MSEAVIPTTSTVGTYLLDDQIDLLGEVFNTWPCGVVTLPYIPPDGRSFGFT